MSALDPVLDRGVVVVSIDTELAWGGAHRRGADAPAGGHEREREVIAGILDVFAARGIGATWAVVGHLFLPRCAPVGGRVHPEIVRPTYPWLTGDWFDVDPATDRDEDPSFYAPDVVDAILRCPVRQEVGCHSFSHPPAIGASAEAFASDLDACRRVASDSGVDLQSFVYPRNAIDHVGVLAARGFTCYRGPTSSGMTRPIRGSAALVDRVHPLTRSAVRPVRDPHGIWNLPQTFLLAPATRGRRLPAAIWARRPIARLRQAAGERSLFHLWFHPYNVTADPHRAFDVLQRICAEVARLRDAGRVDVMTMGDLAAHLDARRAG